MGRPVGYRTSGTLVVAADDGDRAWAEELYDFQRHLGLDVEWLTGRRARQLEPGIAPGVRGAVWAPGDHQVDNRLLVGALLDAAAAAGVGVRRDRAVARRVLGRLGDRRAPGRGCDAAGRGPSSWPRGAGRAGSRVCRPGRCRRCVP